MITHTQNIKIESVSFSKVELGKPGEAEAALKELWALKGKIVSEHQ